MLRRALLVSLIAAFVTPACGGGDPRPLANTFESPDALARAVLDQLAHNDSAGLRALALSEEEFRSRVWPELPVSRPERNVPFEYVWRDLRQKSEGHLRQTLAEHGGRRYALVKVEFLGETTPYRTFQVAREAQLLVRDDRGEEHPIRVFGSVLRDGSRHKLFSYVID
jgi:hypothetical protein